MINTKWTYHNNKYYINKPLSNKTSIKINYCNL